MKIVLLTLLIAASYTLNAQVAINTDGSSSDASAMLEVKSTTKGFLPPRMTEAQMNAIADPVEGLIVYCTDCDPKGPYYFDGVLWVSFSYNSTSFNDVTNSTTGETWMDRNLGAYRVATSSTDEYAYGDLYQWGRAADGHEKRSSNVTSTNATTAVPNDGNAWDGLFITESSSPYDWLAEQDATLWQGVNGTNNPCPTGYRLPTDAELDAERTSWGSNNSAGAFASVLKLPVAGYRYFSNGSLSNVGSSGRYWSSTINGTSSRYLNFYSSHASMSSSLRARGFSVRCIKD